ncbi:MAG: methyl-accepting chemotaxis protein [Oscillospiraceae bacterium]
MLKNMKIGTRLIITFGIIILFTAIIIILALTGLGTANKGLQSFVDHPYTADSAIKTCRIEVNVAARTIREMYIADDEKLFVAQEARIDQAFKTINENVEIFSAAYTENDGLVDKYKTALNKWISIGSSIIDEIKKGNLESSRTMILEQCDPALTELVNVAKEINEKTAVMQAKALTDSERNNTNISILVLALLVVTVAFCCFMAVFVTKSIVKPTNEIEFAASQMANGILGTKISYEGKDEIGNLARSMRTSMERLSFYISDIDTALATMATGDFNIGTTEPFVGDFENIEKSFREFSTKMSYTLDQIGIASEQVSSGSEQVSAISTTLSQGATEQASSVQQLSATIDEISEQINSNALNAKNANILSSKAGEGVMSSNAKMSEMIAAMSEISQKSNEIGKIIKTIDDIAFQTNILALNAAVEAARAGAAGKGFAVVADEVRNLAQKSAEAANNTTALIEGTVAAVSNGTRIVDETAQSLLAVVEDASTVTGMIADITSASADQASSAEQIAIGMEQISTVVQTNSATAEESAAASQELNSQAETLKTLIRKFKLRRG